MVHLIQAHRALEIHESAYGEMLGLYSHSRTRNRKLHTVAFVPKRFSKLFKTLIK